jgi:ABC-type dipeptide/oligopeptide/nickel transport system permease component
VDRSVILGAKWCGGIVRFRWLGYALLALGTVGVGCGALHPAAALLMATAIAVHIAFLASLAVSVSLACRNTFWSNFTMTLMLLLVFAGSWVAAAYYELFFGMGYTGQSEWWDYFAQMGLNPLATWWSLGFNWEEWRHIVSSPPNPERDQFSAVLAGMGVYAALAGLLWWLACQQLRRLDSP